MKKVLSIQYKNIDLHLKLLMKLYSKLFCCNVAVATVQLIGDAKEAGKNR